MSYINWNIKSQDPSLVKNISTKLECSDIVSRLLINRGITSVKQANSFLNPDSESLQDPFLLNDMDKAVERINLAIKKNEKICIYGDYDVDGITSVSVLYLYLKHFTDNVTYYIPDRFSQGYGINNNALDKIAATGCKLIITVDTGISALNEIKYASSIDVDVVVTDHHECQDEIPDACAVINPKRHDSTYPFSKLAGVGVVYKLTCALDYVFNTDHSKKYIDLVAVGTIADIMPLIDENRYIVKSGLEKMERAPHFGLKCLMENCQNISNITSGTVSFVLAPRINAAGRMDSAEVAVKLFTTEDSNEANSIAEHLCKLNVERQKIENDILDKANAIISEHELDKKYNALVLWDENWHSGVIGIVASKLKDKYNKPVVLFSVSEHAKGSGRSVAPFNLYDAFEKTGDIILQYGGHKYAAGILLENDRLFEFRDRLSWLVGEYTSENVLEQDIDVECVLPATAVCMKTVKEINRLQPYGKSNDIPLFCLRNIKISDVLPTTNNKHLRLRFSLGNKTVTAFYFGVTPNEFDYRENDFVDVICELGENEYKNVKSVQLIIRDIRYSENQLELLKNKRNYCDCADGIISTMLPKRSDIASVYKYFLFSFSKGRRVYNIDTIASVVNGDLHTSIGYEKVYFSIKTLMELGVIEGYIKDGELVLNKIPNDRRFSLSDSKILSSIYEKAGVKFGDSI